MERGGSGGEKEWRRVRGEGGVGSDGGGSDGGGREGGGRGGQ